MLEKVKFNKKRFRYREESSSKLLIYDLRYGNMYILTGETKENFKRIVSENIMSIDTNEKHMKFLCLKKILVGDNDDD